MVVKIAGAGIAGLTCAINLAKQEKEVIVYEKRNRIGRKRPDYQGFYNWFEKKYDFNNLQELTSNYGVSVKEVVSLKRIRRYSPNLQENIVTNHDKPVMFVVERSTREHSIESQLANSAREAGVKIEFNSPKKPFEVDILATGAFRTNGRGIGALFDDTNLNQEEIIICNNQEYSPGAYMYAIPAGGKKAMVISCCLWPEYYNSLRERYERGVKEFPPIKNVIDGATRLYSYSGRGAIGKTNTAEKKGCFYIGETGGFMDALWGFGMALAMGSAYYAAKAIIEQRSFDSLWRPALQSYIEIQLRRRALFDRLKNDGLNKIFARYPAEITLSNFLDFYKIRRLPFLQRMKINLVAWKDRKKYAF